MRAYNGKIFKLEKHLQRLRENLRAVSSVKCLRRSPHDSSSDAYDTDSYETSEESIGQVSSKYKSQLTTLNSQPIKVIEDLEEKIKKELKKSKLKNARIRVSTDGKIINIVVNPLPSYPKKFYTDGVKLITVPTARNIPSAIDGKIKSGNLLPNIMAKIESCSAFEAVMLNKDGYVVECTVSNIFVVQKQSIVDSRQSTATKKLHPKLWTLKTPPLYMGVLEGITRNTVIEIAQNLGITVEEKPFTKYNLYSVDECFLTNTSMEIIPVTQIDARIIGDGKPGRLTKTLKKEFSKLTR